MQPGLNIGVPAAGVEASFRFAKSLLAVTILLKFKYTRQGENCYCECRWNYMAINLEVVGSSPTSSTLE